LPERSVALRWRLATATDQTPMRDRKLRHGFILTMR